MDLLSDDGWADGWSDDGWADDGWADDQATEHLAEPEESETESLVPSEYSEHSDEAAEAIDDGSAFLRFLLACLLCQLSLRLLPIIIAVAFD